MACFDDECEYWGQETPEPNLIVPLRPNDPASVRQAFSVIETLMRVLVLTGRILHDLSLGIDHNPVVPDRPTQSISVEDTFEHDVLLPETEPMIRGLAEKLWSASRKESRSARTVVLKLKTGEFKIITRSHTPDSPPSSREELTDIALKLRERVDLGSQQRYRLVGVGLSNFQEPEDTAAQPVLFE